MKGAKLDGRSTALATNQTMKVMEPGSLDREENESWELGAYTDCQNHNDDMPDGPFLGDSATAFDQSEQAVNDPLDTANSIRYGRGGTKALKEGTQTLGKEQ